MSRDHPSAAPLWNSAGHRKPTRWAQGHEKRASNDPAWAMYRVCDLWRRRSQAATDIVGEQRLLSLSIVPGTSVRVFDPTSEYSGVFSAHRLTAGFAQKPSIHRYRMELSVTAISTRRFLLRASLLVPSTRGLVLPYPFTLTIDGSMPAWTR